MNRLNLGALALALGLASAGCSGTDGLADAGLPNGPAAAPEASATRVSTHAERSGAGAAGRAGFDALRALGSALGSLDEENAAESAAEDDAHGSGTCDDGVEWTSQPGATTLKSFFDSDCTELARETVRAYAISAPGEGVVRTVTTFGLGDATPISTRTEQSSIVDAAGFDQNGFPNVAGGFVRETASTLTVGNGKESFDSATETVVEPSTTGTSAFCIDSAAFKASGFGRHDVTFGWQGGAPGSPANTRTADADGSVTWQGTYGGSTLDGPAGSLAIAGSAANATCPIEIPAYALSGGESRGNDTIALEARYRRGELEYLSVAQATLANGALLDVTTDANLRPTNDAFITGTVSAGGATVASFDVNRFGDGTLTISSTGNEFVVVSWNVLARRKPAGS